MIERFEFRLTEHTQKELNELRVKDPEGYAFLTSRITPLTEVDPNIVGYKSMSAQRLQKMKEDDPEAYEFFTSRGLFKPEEDAGYYYCPYIPDFKPSGYQGSDKADCGMFFGAFPSLD